MVTLDEVSTLDFINTHLSKVERMFLFNQGVTDYEKLRIFLNENPEWRKGKLSEHYLYVRDRVKKYSKNVKPTIFTVPSFSDESLVYNDNLVKGSSLVLNNPTTTNVGLTDSLTSITVSEIKHRATHVNCFFNNMLVIYNYVGSTRAKKVVSALGLYQKQIERQALETDRRDISLFHYKLDERRALVHEQIVDILAYLIENTQKGFVWGELTPVQKKKYISALTRDFIPDMMVKDKLAEIIATNVTLSEVEKGLTKDDTLDRFIIK